ncbi:MAG: hypothetical protein JW754_04920 [Candidatus Aenigmarchaeota archaeon]|nr:hypothetical protein [Candidatus Aenigmarchaeota archaeon]
MVVLDIKIMVIVFLLFSVIFFLSVSAIPDPIISVQAPENRSYNDSALWVNFSISGDLDWCAYDLNSGGNTTGICGKGNLFNDSFPGSNVSIPQPGNWSGYLKLARNWTIVSARMNASGLPYDGWKTANSNTSNNIWDIDFYNETLGFAVGSSGTILRWNGTGWSIMSSPVSSTLNDVSVYNSTLAFAVMGNGSGGYVIKWDGNQWSIDGLISNSILMSVDFADGSLAFAGDQNSNLYKWNGSWYNQSDPFSTGSVRGISMLNSTFGFAAALSKIGKWNGTHWINYQEIGDTNFRKMKIINSTYGFVAGVATWNNEIVKWNGSGWYGVPTPGTDDMWGVGVFGGRAFMVGENGRIVRCNGFDCSEAYSPTSSDLYCADLTGGIGYSGGQGGVLLGNPSYPVNVTLDVDGSGVPYEWNMTGEFSSSSTAEIDLNASLVNNFLSSCSPSGGYCVMEMNFSSDTPGKIGMTDLSVVYTVNSTINGTEGNNTLVIYANDSSGTVNMSTVYFTIDLTYPVISSTLISPSVVVNGSNVSISINSTDILSGVGSTWASIELPDTSSVVLALNNTGSKNFTTNLTGRYNVTYFTNDTSGNTANSTGHHFLAKPAYNLNLNISDSDASKVNGTVRIYYPNTTELIKSFGFSGNFSEIVPDYIYDIEFSAFNETIKILFRGFNISGFTGKGFRMDKSPVPAAGYLNTYGLNATFTFTSATVTTGYGSTGFTNESHLGFYVCSDWNFTGRSCNGNWTNMTGNSMLDKAANTFIINVSGFSGFAVRQESYCGDNIMDANETCDGTAFGGLTCSDYGHSSGLLSCNANCSVISSSGCYTPSNPPSGPSGSPGAGPSGAPAPAQDETENVTETCFDDWICGNWSECFPNGTQTMHCDYTGNCSGADPRVKTQNCTPASLNGSVCGNQICEEGEDCETCREDCGECELHPSLEDFILNYLWIMVIIAVVIIPVLVYFMKSGTKEKAKPEESLDTEKEHLKKLIKLAQENYYKKALISRETYDSMIDSYRQRMEEISREDLAEKELREMEKEKQERIKREEEDLKKKKNAVEEEKKKIEEEKKKLSEETEEIEKEKKEEVKVEERTDNSMEREKEVMLKLIKSAQKQYYEKGGISKESYEMKVSAARKRIAEIEEQMV